MTKKKAFVVIGVWLALIGLFFWLNATYWTLDVETLKRAIASAGLVAPLIYIVAYTVRPLLLFPASLLSIAGGLVFGPWWGTVWTVIGASAGAIVSFGSARWLSRSWKSKASARKEWDAIQDVIAKKGFMAILFVRLIPLFPFDVVSYGAGLSRISVTAFTWGTVLGIVPGTFAYNQFGYSLGMGDWKTIAFSAVILAACIAIPLWIKYILKKTHQEGQRNEESAR